MIKRIGSMCCVMMLMICMLLISADNALAAQQDPILDGSYLTHDEESIGYDMKITRGEDLLTCCRKIHFYTNQHCFLQS